MFLILIKSYKMTNYRKIFVVLAVVLLSIWLLTGCYSFLLGREQDLLVQELEVCRSSISWIAPEPQLPPDLEDPDTTYLPVVGTFWVAGHRFSNIEPLRKAVHDHKVKLLTFGRMVMVSAVMLILLTSVLVVWYVVSLCCSYCRRKPKEKYGAKVRPPSDAGKIAEGMETLPGGETTFTVSGSKPMIFSVAPPSRPDAMTEVTEAMKAGVTMIKVSSSKPVIVAVDPPAGSEAVPCPKAILEETGTVSFDNRTITALGWKPMIVAVVPTPGPEEKTDIIKEDFRGLTVVCASSSKPVRVMVIPMAAFVSGSEVMTDSVTMSAGDRSSRPSVMTRSCAMPWSSPRHDPTRRNCRL